MEHKQRRALGASDREAWPQCPSRDNCVVSRLRFPGSLLPHPADSLWKGQSLVLIGEAPLNQSGRRRKWSAHSESNREEFSDEIVQRSEQG